MINLYLSGISEVRILKLGDDVVVESLVREMSLLHDVWSILAVDVEELIVKEGVFIEVLHKLVLKLKFCGL